MPGIEDMIAAHRSLERLPERVAELAAPLLDAAIKATAAAGTTPDGKAWAPVKASGARSNVHAAEHISTRALGDVVRMVLDGPDVYAHFGKRGIQEPRTIIPLAGGAIPVVVSEAIDKATAQAWSELTGAR